MREHRGLEARLYSHRGSGRVPKNGRLSNAVISKKKNDELDEIILDEWLAPPYLVAESQGSCKQMLWLRLCVWGREGSEMGEQTK